jgi:hypothetical protein
MLRNPLLKTQFTKKKWSVIAFATLVLSLVFVMAIKKIESAFKTAHAEIQKEKLSQISSVIGSAIEIKKAELISLSRFTLASQSFIEEFSQANRLGQWSNLIKMLDTTRNNTGLDWLGTMDIAGKNPTHKNLPQLQENFIQSQIQNPGERTWVLNRKGMHYLVSVSAIVENQTVLGFLVLGQNMTLFAQENLGPLTRTRIQFLNSKPKRAVSEDTDLPQNELYGVSGQEHTVVPLVFAAQMPQIYAKIEPLENASSTFESDLTLQLLGIGLGVFLLFIVLFNLFFINGFHAPFIQLVRSVSTKELKTTQPIPFTPTPDLSAFESEKLIRWYEQELNSKPRGQS